MDFERGKDPKHTIGIGEFKDSPEVLNVFFLHEDQRIELSEDQFLKVLSDWSRFKEEGRFTMVSEIEFPAYLNIDRTQGSADSYIIFAVGPWNLEFDMINPEDGTYIRMRARDLMTKNGWIDGESEDHRKIRYKTHNIILPKLDEE